MHWHFTVAVWATISAGLTACGEESLPSVDPAQVTPQSVREHFSELPENPPMPDQAQASLGKALFWDPVLSGNQDIACATCHHPDLGYADGRFASQGVGATGLGHARTNGAQLPRNSQTLINVAFNGIDNSGSFDPQTAPMFWDNRVNSLEVQALDPLRSSPEMRGDLIDETQIDQIVLARLNGNAEYVSMFALAFGDNGGTPVTLERLQSALAAFQRTLVANNSPFDHFMRGDRSAMTNRQIVGMQNFIDAGCAQCHSGPMFSDFATHVLSAPDNPVGPDKGKDDTFAFRTPTLRNLAETAPYMHGGSLASLGPVLDFYEDLEEGESRNGLVPRSALDPLITGIRGIEDGKGAIIEFLGALNDPAVDRSIPQSVPSGLPPGGSI